mmetsp:Transcript_67120/g.148711  ORF Transcript_67120/g.148711 Transcript_67120/m.148711 type:complete len:555 (-) Transcript_67120:12-1676(-)
MRRAEDSVLRLLLIVATLSDLVAGLVVSSTNDRRRFQDHHPNANASAIVAGEVKRELWGFPNYAKEIDFGLRSWAELARIHGRYGNICKVENARRQCGNALICKDGVCGECAISRDCGEHYLCEVSESSGRRLCVPRDLQSQWNWREVVCTILVILTAVLSAAAGMGGGGVYVPLLLLLGGLSTKEAVPLSQAMIVGGATVNVLMFCGERHPRYPDRPKIDYDVVMMLNPGLAAGVTLGVICNVISPQWLIVCVLLVTLVIALEKSFNKGLKQWRQESKALAESAAAGSSSSTEAKGDPGGAKLKLIDVDSFVALACNNQRPLGLITCCWVAFLMMNVMKAPQCTPAYWMQLLGMLVICGAFTFAGARTIVNEAAAPVPREKVGGEEGFSSNGASVVGSAEGGGLAWTPRTLRIYPLLSTAAGFLGGFLGIGGGIIMGPLLLELGLMPEASQATTAMFVFLSSSLATIQFMVLGKAMPEYALWFTTWVVLATVVGQVCVDYVLRRWQRSSLIVLSIAAIIAGSLVMMTAIGAKDTITDLARGANMGFVPHHLCE